MEKVSNTKLQYIISENDAGKRLDSFLPLLDNSISRHFAQSLIKNGAVFVNGKKMDRKSYRLMVSDIIELADYDHKADEKIIPRDIKLNIIHQDDDIIAIDKPSGMPVHPGSGNTDNTLVHTLLFHSRKEKWTLSDLQGEERSGIVHRLDMETSGVLIIAKNNDIHKRLQDLFRERNVHKEYFAVVYGNLKNDEYELNSPLGRDRRNRLKISSNTHKPKEAFTRIIVIKRINGFSFIKAYPLTGRTHQIRVHLKEINHPIVGDELYASKKTMNLQKFFNRQNSRMRLMLHSFKILFTHPVKGAIMSYRSNLPSDFINCWRLLKQYHD